MELGGKRYPFDTPATYRIRIQGRIDARWSGNLGGMVISVTQPKGKAPITALTGELIDQASLMGVLSTLYDLGFTLLEVKRLPDQKE